MIVIIHLFGGRFGELGELFRVDGEFLNQQLGSVVKSIHPSQFKRIDHSDLLRCSSLRRNSWKFMAGIEVIYSWVNCHLVVVMDKVLY